MTESERAKEESTIEIASEVVIEGVPVSSDPGYTPAGPDHSSDTGVIMIAEVTVEGTPSSDDPSDPPITYDPVGQALLGGLITGPAAGLEGGAEKLIEHIAVEISAGLVEDSGERIAVIVEGIPDPFVVAPDLPSTPDPIDAGAPGEPGISGGGPGGGGGTTPGPGGGDSGGFFDDGGAGSHGGGDFRWVL